METTEKPLKRFHDGRKRRAGWIGLAIIGFIAFVFLFGAVIMWLWNWLMPAIFHLGLITYWQAVGLAILGRLLFGSMHHGHHSHPGKRYWRRGYRWHDRARCRDFSNGTKWSYYDQFWNEEGEQAFNEFVKKKTGNPA